MIYENLMKVIKDKEPKDLNKEPKDFILFVYANYIMKMIIFNTFSTFSAVILIRVLKC
jgi:hypothetical protein